METRLFQNISSYRDRHGKVRWRFRMIGYPCHTFRAAYGTAAFAREYEWATKGCPVTRDKGPAKRLKGVPLVYFIGAAGGTVKIGFSTDIESRLVRLQTGHPKRLQILAVMPGSLDDEAALHRRFDASRDRGEWFKRTDDLMALIRDNELGDWRTDVFGSG